MLALSDQSASRRIRTVVAPGSTEDLLDVSVTASLLAHLAVNVGYVMQVDKDSARSIRAQRGS